MTAGRPGWTRDQIRFEIARPPRAVPPAQIELKRIDTTPGDRRWRPELHPRDRRGRFIETGDTVRIGHGGATGRVLRTVGADRVEVQRPSGKRSVVHRSQITVTARAARSARPGQVRRPTPAERALEPEDQPQTRPQTRPRRRAEDDSEGEPPDRPRPQRRPRREAAPSAPDRSQSGRGPTIRRAGSKVGLKRPQRPSQALVGTMVARHDGYGGWDVGYLAQRPDGSWGLLADPGDGPEDADDLPANHFVDVVEPDDPRLDDYDPQWLTDVLLEGQLRRMEAMMNWLWRRGRRVGDPTFDNLRDRHRWLADEQQERGGPVTPAGQEEQLPFDDPPGPAPRDDQTPPPRPAPRPRPADDRSRQLLREAAARIADDNPHLAVVLGEAATSKATLASQDGNLVAIKDRNRWRILHAPSGRWVSFYGARSKNEIVEHFDRIQKLTSPDGQPYDWADPELPGRIATERHEPGNSFNQRVRAVEEQVARLYGRDPDTDPEIERRREQERREEAFRFERARQARATGYTPASARDVAPGDEAEFVTTVQWRGNELYTREGALLGRPGSSRDDLPDGSIIAVRGVATGIESEWLSDADRQAGRQNRRFLVFGDGATWTSPDGRSGEFATTRVGENHAVLRRAPQGRGEGERAWEDARRAAAHDAGHRMRAASGLEPGDHLVMTGRVSRSRGGRLVLPGGIAADGTGLAEGDLVEVQADLGERDWAGHRAVGITWTAHDGRTGTAPDSSLAPFGKGEKVLARRGDPPTDQPAPVPDSGNQPKVVPGISRSQRDAIMDSGVEADTAAPEQARAAARLVREREALTAEQMRALADRLRAVADAGAVKPQRAKALHRTSDRLEVSAAQLDGQDITPDQLGGDREVERVRPGDLAEGDTVAVPGPDGQVQTRTVTGLGAQWGSFIPVHLADADGAVERRLIAADATVHRLPDLPGDKALPPARTGPEHITPDRVAVGDRIRAGGRGGHRADTEVEVLSIEHYENGGATAVVRDGPDGIALNERLVADGEDPTAPTVVRLARGPGSADQPWDAVLPDDDPRPVKASQLRLGERVRLENQAPGGSAATGTVIDFSPLSSGEPGRNLTLRLDNGSVRVTSLRDDDDGVRVVHLADPDDNLAGRLLHQRRERERRRHTKLIARDLADIARNVYAADISRARLGAADSTEATVDEINRNSIKSILARRSRTRDMAARLGVPTDDPAALQAVAGRIDTVLEGLGQGVRDSLIRAVRNARPLSGEDDTEARQRVLRQFERQPPVDDDSFASVAQSLAELRQNLLEDAGLDRSEADAFDRPDLPDLSGEGDLTKRLESYRQALGGDGANIGKKRVRRSTFAPTTFEALDNGEVPAIEQTEVWADDKAADGGPGEHAMAHLEVLRAAGRDLDAELQRRIDAELAEITGGQDPAEVAQQLEQARQELRRINQAQLAAIEGARDGFAAQHGFANWVQLVNALRRARRDGDTAEIARLRDLYARGDALADAADNAFRQQYVAAMNQRNTLSARLAKLRLRTGDARRRAAQSLLRDVRPDGVGGVTIDWYGKDRTRRDGEVVPGQKLTERHELVKAMRFAAESYPAAWLRMFKDHAERRGQRWRVGKIKRGHYQDWSKQINLSDGIAKTSDGGDLGNVAVHEMGHGMESAVPGLLTAQLLFLWDRTSTGKVGDRTREDKTAVYKNEMAYRDQFPEHYSGKDYGDTNNPNAFELFTTSIESLMAGEGYLDDDMRAWLLATLTLLGREDA